MRKGVLPLVATVFVIGGLFVLTLSLGYRPNLGLDLQGGVSVVLQPVVDGENATEVSKESLDQTKQIIEKRVNALGVGEPEVTTQGSTIVVQLPGIKDQERALELVGKTAELRFRPVVQNLAPAPTEDDQERIEELRAEMKVPEGTSALDVYNAEQTARGLPTIPDPGAPQPPADPNAAPAQVDPNAAPATTAPATTAPPTTAATGDGTGGSRSAKVAKLRRQDPTTTTPTTAPPPTTTTTIDPAPKNQYGVSVYAGPDGSIDEKLQELLQLETASQQADLQTTPPEDDAADATVVLDGSPEDVDGKTVMPRYQLGATLLTGRAIEDAEAKLGGSAGAQWVVNPVFREGPDGIDLFNLAAGKCNSGGAECPTQQLAIVLDGQVISAPTINEATFDRDKIEISGSFTEASAKDLATALRFGSLPLTLEAQQVQTVSATLGEGALQAVLIAGAIGIFLVIGYMVLYYRLLGTVTFGALVLQAMLLWSLVSLFGEWFGLTLTLAGIVGIVISVGVSLDSSIVFYESLKEDVRGGRTVRSAVDGSFSAAYGTIIKADMSSLIGAAVLYMLSIGPVRGFAFFLGVSTILDLVMAYVFTRPSVRLMARSGLGNRPPLFGIPVDDAPEAPVEAPELATVGSPRLQGAVVGDGADPDASDGGEG